MDIFRLVLTGTILAILLSFSFKPQQSRYEINRRAEHERKFKNLARFLEILPGLKLIVAILALADAILLTIFAALDFGVFGGGALALAAIVLAWLLGRALRSVANSLIGAHVEFFNKYFAWAKPLGHLAAAGDEPRIGSENELVHIIREGDFLDDGAKNLVENALNFRDKTVRAIMTPRDQIAFLHAKDPLTPKLLDDLFNSGHKIFPVVQNGLDHAVGLLYLDDVLPVEQEEKILTEAMRKCPPPIDVDAPLESALRQMCEYHSTALLATRDGKIVGLLTLSDLTRALFQGADVAAE